MDTFVTRELLKSVADSAENVSVAVSCLGDHHSSLMRAQMDSGHPLTRKPFRHSSRPASSLQYHSGFLRSLIVRMRKAKLTHWKSEMMFGRWVLQRPYTMLIRRASSSRSLVTRWVSQAWNSASARASLALVLAGLMESAMVGLVEEREREAETRLVRGRPSGTNGGHRGWTWRP